MQVTSYGLFWRADEIEWFPGHGNRNEFRLLGRVTDATSTSIGDLEALLIAAMGPKLNYPRMRFSEAESWEQIGKREWEETYRKRIAPDD